MDRGLGNFPEYVRPRTDGTADVDAIVSRAITDALQYVDGELAPERAKATEYYQGKSFGNEQGGRSKAILTEVRDGIIGVEPSIIRIVHGPERPVEYAPNSAADVALAEQATDYAGWVYNQDNRGLLVTKSVLRDGLLKKLGVAKVGMDETPKATTTLYRGLTREELEQVLQDENAELLDAKQVAEWFFDAEIRTTEPSARIWIVPVPPDDFFWNREARSLDDAILVGHRLRLTRSELRQMGVSDEDLDEHGGVISATDETLEEVARRQGATSGISLDPEMGEENRRVLYCEAYMMLAMHHDDSGKGIAELRKICTLGNNHHVIKNEPAPCKPFAIFSPDPEPHAMLGGSWYDRLKDIQEINSQLLRGMFDSLAMSVFPRPTYVEGMVSLADLMNNGVGTPVRQKQAGMVEWQVIPFAGDKILPVLGAMREVVERRIGNQQGAGSLDLDALQSTGKEAADAAITAAQAQPELLAWLFAEQFLKPVFRLILTLVAHPKSRERLIRLRGTHVPVNPAMFDPNMEVNVNVCLGAMDVAKKIAVLRDVVADQSAILAQYGPDNPVVTIQMLRNSKAKLLELQGIKDVDAYYKPIPDDWQPPPPPEPEPSPDELWIQAEKEMAFQKQMKELAIKQDELKLAEEKARAEMALKEAELAFREREAFASLDLERERLAVEYEKIAVSREQVAVQRMQAENPAPKGSDE